MSTVIYHYVNMQTKLLCTSDPVLCKEVGHSGLTRAIPFFIGEDFHTLIAGGRNFTDEDAIEVFKDLTGIEIGESNTFSAAPHPSDEERN